KNQRVGRNPKTGEEVSIEPRRVIVVKSSQVLKERVDSGNK
ncbi:MAG: HU family DNA-binding protein, partial [Robiginitomaculum sp.]|nr:HU family DNA-binding protein [Robiginitomaculum sp.]